MNLSIKKIYKKEADQIDGSDIRIIRQLPGHKDIRITMIYTPIAKGAKDKVQSPPDRIMKKKSWDENKK